MKSILSIAAIFCSVIVVNSQEKLPYYEIHEAPEEYTATTTASRMIDGLGFRFYWATEGLQTEDLNFKPSEEARTSMETIQHIFGLTNMIHNCVTKVTHDNGNSKEMSYEELRKSILVRLKISSDILRKSDDLSQFKIVMGSGDRKRELPFWNLINGPISDAIWHSGQLASFRRSSGNPYNSKASVLTGTVRN